MKKIYEKRINQIIDKLNKDNKDALIIQNNWDVLYLTGFYTSKNECILLISNNKLIFITDGRFINQFNQQVEGFDLIINKNKFQETKKLIKENKWDNLLFNFNEFSYQNILDLEINVDKSNNIKNYIKELRRKKTKEEIEYIKKAGQIAEKSLLKVLDKIKIGMSELEIQNLLNSEMINQGSERESFPTIIASGKDNGASPHGVPTERKIQEGDFITIDFGATYNNYISDITRTIAVGKVDEKMKYIYNQTLKAKNECVKLLKPGVNIKDIHNKANKIIKDAGYDFLHGVGHGIGLEVHELPFLNGSSEEILMVGDTHTIEPGIYVPGVCGVRIEDDYVITNDGNECLTPNVTTELITI